MILPEPSDSSTRTIGWFYPNHFAPIYSWGDESMVMSRSQRPFEHKRSRSGIAAGAAVDMYKPIEVERYAKEL
jgi:hypothetical protein